MPNIDNIVKQLKNRKVFRSLAIYAGFAFVLIQVCSIVFPALYLPDWTMTLLVVLIIIGFPIIAVLSWIYDITPTDDGEAPPTEASQPLGVYALTGLVLTIIGIGFWVVVGVFGVTFGGNDEVPSIAIIPFDNKGADEDEFYAYSISSDLISDVAGAGIIRVAGLKDIEKLEYQVLNYNELSEKLLVRYIAQGTLWKVDSVFQLSMELYDTKLSKVLWSESWQNEWDELTSIKNNLADNILNELKVFTNQKFNKTPTNNTEAYEYYLKGKYKWKNSTNIEEREIAKGLLAKSIELDDNLLEAKIQIGRTYIYYDLVSDLNSAIYEEMYDYEEALAIFKMVLKQAQEINDKFWIGRSLRNIGIVYTLEDKFDQALKYYMRSVDIAHEIGDKKGMSWSFNNIAICYTNVEEHLKALDYHNRALKLRKEIGDKYVIGLSLGHIMYCYKSLGDYENAFDYNSRALDLYTEINNHGGVAFICYKKGNLYYDQEEIDSALHYYTISLNKYEKIGDHYMMAGILIDIGEIYKENNNYNKALYFFDRAYKIEKERDDKRGIGDALSNIGDTYYLLGDLDKSLEYYNRTHKIDLEFNDTHHMGISFGKIGNIFEDKGNFDKAVYYYNLAYEEYKELSEKLWMAHRLGDLGIVYYKKGDYNKAIQFLNESINIQNGNGLDKRLLWNMTTLSLISKGLNVEYDVMEIQTLIKKNADIGEELNYYIYQLLEDSSYLETAYNQVQEKAANLEPDVAAKFLSYPIPKAIVEEWEKIK